MKEFKRLIENTLIKVQKGDFSTKTLSNHYIGSSKWVGNCYEALIIPLIWLLFHSALALDLEVVGAHQTLNSPNWERQINMNHLFIM